MDRLAFGVLGPLAVARNGDDLRLSGSRRRVLLVRLLVAANEVVPVGRLIEDLWDGIPPAGAVSTLQSHVSALRQVLGRDRLQHRDGGYVVTVADGELDADVFQDDMLKAQRARDSGENGLAAELWAQALRRWRGHALSDAEGMGWAVGDATRLDEQRTVALEEWLDARLVLGDHAGVASDAEQAVAEHPLREGLWAKLIVGLYRSGRQSDALRAYRRVAQALGEELGIEPSPQLARLEEAVLLHKPEVQWHPPTNPDPSPPATNTAQRAGLSATRDDPALPTGTVTFLSTNIEESTALLQRLGSGYATVLRRHRELLRAVAVERGGVEVSVDGDTTLFVFSGTASAMEAAVAGQVSLAREPWPDGLILRVRMGVHTGEASPDDGDYVALAVHQAARVASAAHGGQILVSETTTLVGVLPAGVSAWDRGLYRVKDFDGPVRLHQLCHADMPADFPALRAKPVVIGNLPVAVSSFVGRVDELGQINKLLGAHRLVTLCGPGGTGKTRLSLEVAATQVESFADGIWFIDLAPIVDPELVPAVVADTLGVQPEPDRSLTEVLADWVRDQNVLLVFDNCEHVIQISAEVIERLLTSGPTLRVLATSRERLRISGEAIWQVPPLRLPGIPTGDDIDPDVDVEFVDSVRLFIDRASAAQQDLRFVDGDIQAIANIVVRLDGLPLAIELAAACVSTLTVQDIAAHLDDRFLLLVEGSRTAMPRHQTLLAAIDWSYQLLQPAEQAVLRRLSVFAGSFTVDAAGAVAAGTDVPLADVSGIVLTLAAKSLLGRVSALDTSAVDPGSEANEPRFRLLETIRQYATDRLGHTDQGREAVNACDRHTDYYLALAQVAEPELYREHQGRWLASLEREHDNIRVVLARLLGEPGRTGDRLMMVVALRRFWHVHNHHHECLSYLEPGLLSSADDVPARVRAAALALAAEIVRFSDAGPAKRYGQHALSLADQLGDNTTAARTLSNALALVAHFDGEQESALALAAEAVERANETGDPVVIGEALLGQGLVAEEDFPLAKRLNEEAILATTRSGDRNTASWAHNNLGSVLLAAGEIDAARAHVEEAVAIFAELDSESAVPLINLGWLHLRGGDLIAAIATFRRAMGLARSAHLRNQIAFAAMGTAISASANEQWNRAATLHAFADAELADAGWTWTMPESSYRDDDRDRLRAHMGEAFDRAYDAATRMSRDSLMQLALESEHARRSPRPIERPNALRVRV